MNAVNSSPKMIIRAMTLLEVVVAVSIMSMVSLLIYGAFESLSRGKRAESMRSERTRQGRQALDRMVREFTSAYLSNHQPFVQSQITRTIAFIAEDSIRFDRVDFASFSHLRVTRDEPESDQAEIGYAVVKDPDVQGKMDLVRREQTPIDTEPRRGGIIDVLAEDVESFELKYLDAQTGLWTDRWDTTQSSGQVGRLPYEVYIKLVLHDVGSEGRGLVFQTKCMLPIIQPLKFGISQ